jgi:enamine deaminase RidA (YjgF/YER057c/UK114 family)
MAGSVEYMSPPGLHQNPAYSQVVVTTGSVRTVYVGGQDGVDAAGTIVGHDNRAQTDQIFANLEAALAAGGARLEHVVKWNVYIVEGQPIEEGFAVFQQTWGNRPNPPLITGVFVARLAHPDFLVEIDAVAVVPDA